MFIKNKITIWDYIFLTRPILLVPVWTFFLLGYFRAGGRVFSINQNFVVTIFAYTFLAGSGYILNQIVDVKADKINKKHLLLAEGLIPAQHVYIEFAVLLVCAFLLTLKLPLLTIVFFCISFLLSLLYSLPRIAFKGIPVLDFVTNSIGYGFLNFSIGWMIHKSFSMQTLIYSLPYVFAVAAIFINTTILDIEGDKICGSLTTGVIFGRKRGLILSTFLIAVCALLSLTVRDWVCLFPAVISVPLFILAACKADIKFIRLSISIGGPLLVLMAGIIFPYFLILFLLVFIFLRIYYKKKFGITYPGLSSHFRRFIKTENGKIAEISTNY